MSDVLTGPWWRILTMTAPDPAGLPASAEDDYAAIHSAAVAAARQGRPPGRRLALPTQRPSPTQRLLAA